MIILHNPTQRDFEKAIGRIDEPCLICAQESNHTGYTVPKNNDGLWGNENLIFVYRLCQKHHSGFSDAIMPLLFQGFTLDMSAIDARKSQQQPKRLFS